MKNILIHLALIFALALQTQAQEQAIHVTVTGEGKPVMLIPGFTVPGDSWQATVDQLQHNYQCHVVTLAGFGGTQPISFPWLPQVNEALENYIEKNKLTDVTLIGHSLGGTLATWLASREGNRISRLVLVDALPAAGALMIPNFDPDNLAYDSPYNNQQLSMENTQFEQLASGMSQGMSLNAEAQAKIKAWILEADRKTYVYGYTDYLKLDMREDLKKITAPVTILAADQPYGKAMVEQTYQGQYTNLANYDLIIAENSAHFVMLDQPQWFAAQLEKILSAK